VAKPPSIHPLDLYTSFIVQTQNKEAPHGKKSRAAQFDWKPSEVK
jgi:hypothetical protein